MPLATREGDGCLVADHLRVHHRHGFGLGRIDLSGLDQIAELERERDAIVETAAPDHAVTMIQQLASLRGVGVQSATVLVREAFVRWFANGKAWGAYAGLTATPYSSGNVEREQGIGKA